jgi:hypothetical protein
MPDLDLIKQGEQGGAGPARAVRPGPGNPGRWPRGCRDAWSLANRRRRS